MRTADLIRFVGRAIAGAPAAQLSHRVRHLRGHRRGDPAHFAGRGPAPVRGCASSPSSAPTSSTSAPASHRRRACRWACSAPCARSRIEDTEALGAPPRRRRDQSRPGGQRRSRRAWAGPAASRCWAKARTSRAPSDARGARPVAAEGRCRARHARSRCWAPRSSRSCSARRNPLGARIDDRRKPLSRHRRDGVEGPGAGVRHGRCGLHPRRTRAGAVQSRGFDGSARGARARRGRAAPGRTTSSVC